MTSPPIGLTLRDAPHTMAVERIGVGGAVLRLTEPLPPGRWMYADLAHPTFGGPVWTAARVSWSQPIVPGLPTSLVALEFVGSWEGLVGVRRAILGATASTARAGDEEVGFVLREPDGSFTCHAPQTEKLAIVLVDGAGVWVRRRDPRDPGGSVLPASGFADAVAQALGRARSDDLRFEPPLDAPGDARGAARPGRAPAPTPTSGANRRPPAEDEEALLAARTQLLDAPRARTLDEEAILAAATDPDLGEEALLAARTVVLRRSPAPPEPDPEHTVALPKDRLGPREPTGPDRRWSKVLLGPRFLGWVAPDSSASWSLYDEQGQKLAVLVAEGGKTRVCLMGDKAAESLEYIEASDAPGALAAAFDVEGRPRIEPPLAGLG